MVLKSVDFSLAPLDSLNRPIFLKDRSQPIVRSALERRCEGGNRKTVSPAWFTKLADGRYALKQEVS